ncbi:MAG: hypothetical protein ACIPMY_06385 [Rickettsia endosymbiont of Pentastiridius leporinus]
MFSLSNNYFGDMGLSKLIDVLSQRPNTDTEILELRNINISLENKIIIDKFSKFLKNSNVKVLNISSNPIKLEHLTKFLETIQETNVSYLDISSIFFNNDHISALSSFIKNCKLAELYFSLSKEVNKESKKELSSAIQDNKSLINCFIMAANIGLKVQERKELEKQIKDTTEQNKYLLEDVAKFLKDFNEEPNNRIPGDILNHYLKSYLGLNKDCLKEELEKLGVTEVGKVFDNVDDYLSIAGKDAAHIGSI